VASKSAAVLLSVPGPDGDREVRLTSADKVYFPERGITKGEVVEYYRAVAAPLLGVLRERPTNLKRYPDGVDGEAFFAKRLPKGAPPYVETARVTFPSGRTADSLCPTEQAVLVWAANMGTFDFHPWPVRRADTNRPDELRIDLDPQPGTDFADAVCRIRPEWDFVAVRHAVIAIARRVADRLPEKATVAWWKEERGERVFLDYNQAARDRTVASAWSVRGRPRATVSMPVTWETLPEVEPEDFDVRTVPGHYAERGDPHAGMDDAVGGLEAALEWFATDERDRGLGDLPYPPEYPKMPGEPMRVQPSRARRPAGTDEP
jgi:DNA primase